MRYRNPTAQMSAEELVAEQELLAKLSPSELAIIAEAAEAGQGKAMRVGVLLGVAVGSVAMYALGRWGIIKCK